MPSLHKFKNLFSQLIWMSTLSNGMFPFQFVPIALQYQTLYVVLGPHSGYLECELWPPVSGLRCVSMGTLTALTRNSVPADAQQNAVTISWRSNVAILTPPVTSSA